MHRLAVLWCLLGAASRLEHRRACQCAEAVGHPPFSVLSESQAPVVAVLQTCQYCSVRDPPWLWLRSSARRTISRLSSAAGLTAIIHLLQAERIHHDLLDLLRRCFSAVWTVCVLILHGFLVEADVWDGRDHFAKLQLVLPLLDIWDWLAAAFLCTVLLLVLRLVSVRSPLVRFACRWLCSSLACCWL